ncbi:MAG: transcription termination/antitermination protein NusG [Dysgonamonadaceae bacterium]|jgi:transcriptional antiterminator NusG|nr:transcription termination/antitermination protein NusG [Dysgonamonadaceae bacterium]
MAELEYKFFVLRTVSGKENKIHEYLKAEIRNRNLEKRIPQVLIPTEKVVQLRNGKKVTKDKAYLPGYVIVECESKDNKPVGEVAQFLKSVNYVMGFLGGDKPAPLRQSEVNRILGTVDELQEQPEEFDVQFMVGETVKVTYGPFNGFHGEIKEINREKKKLTVLVKIFGRGTPLELGYLQVEKE